MALNYTLTYFSIAASLALSGCGNSQILATSNSTEEGTELMKPAANTSTLDAKDSPVGETEGEWVSLFNGNDLQGWQTFVSINLKTANIKILIIYLCAV